MITSWLATPSCYPLRASLQLIITNFGVRLHTPHTPSPWLGEAVTTLLVSRKITELTSHWWGSSQHRFCSFTTEPLSSVCVCVSLCKCCQPAFSKKTSSLSEESSLLECKLWSKKGSSPRACMMHSKS